MSLELELQNLFNRLTDIDVEGIFPEHITENTCYTEMGQQLLLQDIKNMRLSLGRELVSFFEILGVADNRQSQEGDKTLVTEKLLKSISKDPYGKKVPEPVKELDVLKENINLMDQKIYVMAMKVLTMFCWKSEVLADCTLSLKSKLADVCSKVYQQLVTGTPVVPYIAPPTAPKAVSDYTVQPRDAVMFGPPPEQKTKKTIDVAEYAEYGAMVLIDAVYTSFYTYQIALNRDDNIQAFRAFRRTVRMRKRFGITSALQDYFIKQDQTMTLKSLQQMGKPIDDLELRKFEVLMRTEQQIRNLKYKTIIAG